MKFFNYANSTAKTKPYKIDFIEESDIFGNLRLKGKYLFHFKDKTYSNEDIVDTNFLNSYAIEKAKEHYVNNINIWFDPNNPTHSSLHHRIPLKEAVYLMILWSVGIYFLWLGLKFSRG